MIYGFSGDYISLSLNNVLFPFTIIICTHEIKLQLELIFFLISLGRDTWDERPYTKESVDWDNDNSPNRYRDRTYDEDYDVEKEDSDSESKYNYSNKKSKDLEQFPSPAYVEKKVNINLNPNVTNSPKKTSKPIKKVDLGAAANFGKGQNNLSSSGINTCK